MSEQKYESKIGSIAADTALVYKELGNLQNLNKVKDLIPKDKVQELEIESDCIRLKMDGLMQKVTFRIIDREENKTLKFGVENLPMDLFFWIQFKEVSPCDTRFKLTLKADIPMMFRMMFESKIQKGLDQAVDMLSQLPYNTWQK